MSEFKRADTFDGIVGISKPMQEVYRLIRKAAKSDIAVLILGESGTGKELVARSIHKRSNRQKEPFVPVNMGALSPELISSELFGHEKGAYTGAIGHKEGRFERAHGGSLFMDEISTMDEKTQISLLRVLETKKVRRIGASDFIDVDVRVIGATNKNLRDYVQKGKFREDLYYRFNVFTVHLPPLRGRKKDIPLIAEKYLKDYSRKYSKNMRPFSDEVLSLLVNYPWPGNVRELKNVIHRAVVLTEGNEIAPKHLPERIFSNTTSDETVILKIGSTIKQAEKTLIEKTLEYVGGNKQEAARILDISRKSLYNKIREYDIDV